MNDLFSNILNLYTTYSIVKFVITIVLMVIFTSGFFYFRSNSKKVLLFSVCSQIITIAIYLFIAYIGEAVFSSIQNGLNQIGLIGVLLLNIINISKYVGDHVEDIKKKRPDPDRVNRSHFRASLNTVITLILLGLSIGFFMPPQLGQVVISISLAGSLSIVVNHIIIRKLFVDESVSEG